ncbi:DUF1214 domain-containing protein [Paucibacter sp. TC2R-5]|uniref:DUF1254 domain-containing protein n=1 Tax=Paucibacter sp. TC2R-5 TaxID=2893555 RepID=UPI0021E3C4A7|nr:DUF1254 domain-containing protein [Paucibacter sp. TC2R-5]MCV2361304.1 DUF1214 domain-containing protein [Paucibacter sp. TC2R-5]
MSLVQRCAAAILTSLLFAVAATAAVTPARTAEPAQDEALAYATGVQTYINGFPMMDLYRTLWETSFDPKRGHDRTVNEFFAFDRLITSKDDWVITPNNDTIYSRAFLDLRKEPIIIAIPPTTRQYWVPISDLRHDFDANLSWDTVGARGGAFALCPPGWQGVLPEGVKRIDMGTPIGWMLPRFAVNGDADLPGAVALQKQVRLVPLSQWGATNVARPKPDPADFPRFTRAELTDAKAYFTSLNTLLRFSPRIGNPMDEAMVGWLREIGMDPAAGFDWDKLSPQARRGLERATADAHRIIAERMPRLVPIVNNWQLARLDKRISGDPVFAAGAAMLGLLWNPKEISTYDVAFFDGKSAPLDGQNRYVIKFSPQPPVNAFWSVTMYSAETQIFVPNPINRYSVGDRTQGMVYGKDGSLEVFLQAEAPTDPRERANWLPAPKGRFYLVTRHYSPKAAILTGDWTPPPVIKR